MSTDPRLIDVVSDLPAIWLDAEDVVTIRGCMDAGMYGEQETRALRSLLCGIHELCIEIDRSHERVAELEERLSTVTNQRDALRWPHMWARTNSNRTPATQCIYCKESYAHVVGVPCPRTRANYERQVAWEREHGEGMGIDPVTDPYSDEYVRPVAKEGGG